MKELASLGIDRAALIAALQAQNVVQPAGTIQTGNETAVAARLRRLPDPSRTSRNVNFAVGGRMLRLSDIAKVRRGYADPPQPHVSRQRRAGHRPCHRHARRRRHPRAGQEHQRRRWREITADLPLGIEPKLVADQAVTVESAIADFMTSLWQAVAIILVVSFISLGVRPGLVIALAIPLTLAIVFSVMELANIDMQRISLGALIIALALLVDDAMTTTDAMLTRLAQGDGKVRPRPSRSAPMPSRCWPARWSPLPGFVPVGFAASSAGEYTFSLFAVVGIALVVSWFVAVIFAPLLGVVILTPPKPKQSRRPASCSASIEAFSPSPCAAQMAHDRSDIGAVRRLVPRAAADPPAVLPLVRSARAAGRPQPCRRTPRSMPARRSPSGSTQCSRTIADVARWSTYVGRGAIRFYLPLNVQLPNDFFAQAVIVAKDVAARERLKAKLEKAAGRRFSERGGPRLSAGARTAGRMARAISRQRPRRCAGARDRLQARPELVATNPQAMNVNFDWIEPARQVRIRIDQDEARLLGLSSQALASVLNTVISGIPITQVRDDIYLVDVVVRATDEQRVSLATLRHLQVPLPNGRTVPLSQFATFDYEQDYPLIWRRDRVPTLTVQADVAAGRPAGDRGQLRWRRTSRHLRKTLPPAYRIAVGGTVEESEKSQASVIAVVPLMLLIMLTVLMVQLRSFQRLFLVLSVAPLGLIGVVAALLLSGRPLGFVAILGILALLGMITKNAVILIGQIEAERAPGQGRVARRRSMPAARASARSC